MKQTKQTLQNRADRLMEEAAMMADAVTERMEVKKQDFTEEVNKAFMAGCHVDIVLGGKKLQYDVMNVTTSTLSSSSSADKVQRKVVFTTAIQPITKRGIDIGDKMVEKIWRPAKAYQAQKVEQQKMRAEDKKAKKAKVEVKDENIEVPFF